MIFITYQSSIVGQFEFLMHHAINAGNVPRSKTGHDAILAREGIASFGDGLQ